MWFGRRHELFDVCALGAVSDRVTIRGNIRELPLAVIGVAAGGTAVALDGDVGRHGLVRRSGGTISGPGWSGSKRTGIIPESIDDGPPAS